MAKTKVKKVTEVVGFPCGWCDATGEDKGKKCPVCKGKGRLFPEKK